MILKNVQDLANIWSDFKNQIVSLFATTPTSPDASETERTIGRVYLTDTIANKETVGESVAVTPTGVLDAVVIGTYSGTGGTQSISLGFKPRAVLIYNCGHGFYDGGMSSALGVKMHVDIRYGGLMVDGWSLHGYGEITDKGFKVSNDKESEGNVRFNINGSTYLYIAWR